MKKVFALALMLVLCFGMLVACGGTENTDSDKASATITVIDKDNKEFTYDIKCTNGTTMREALFEAGLISEEQHGAMFIEDIDGHIADVENDGCTWMIQDKDKNDLSSNMDEVTVKDGDVFYLQYYVVPNFDD